MNDATIKVENLTKQYRIGTRDQQSDTFMGSIAGVVSRPLKSIRNLRSLSRFDEDESQNDGVIRALDDVSFSVRQGEALAVIGRNGSGKSTLLKLLSNITEPTSGRALVNGRVSSLLEVGMGFHPELTGRENVYLNGAILGMSRKEINQKFDQISDFAGVEKFMETPVKRYSSGMKMRLAFAVAAHLEPEILLVDEVLAVGDAEFQQKCLGKMESVAQSGRTVIFVSHNMGAVRSLCDRAIVLDSGHLIQEETSVDEAVEFYLRTVRENTQTAKFQRSEPPSGLDRWIESAWVTSDGRFDPSGYFSGRPLEFHVKIKSETSLVGTIIGASIDNMYGQRMFTCVSRSYDESGEVNESGEYEQNFICSVPSVPLAQGQYTIKIAVEGGAQASDILDPAFSLDVALPIGVPSVHENLKGVIYMKSEWQSVS